MLYRIFATAIVVFWITMTTLLVRKELGLGGASLREVPVEHVARLMFQREQTSDLQLFSEKTAIGHLRLQPQLREADGQRQLTAAGSFQLQFPGLPRQRIVWSGDVQLDEAFHAQRGKATINLREPTNLTIELDADFAQRTLRYLARTQGHELRRGHLRLDDEGVRGWLREQGVDVALLESLRGPGRGPLALRAEQSSVRLRGEKIDTFLVTAEQSGQTLFEAHVSQLGQVLRVRTLLGYSAAAEELAP